MGVSCVYWVVCDRCGESRCDDHGADTAKEAIANAKADGFKNIRGTWYCGFCAANAKRMINPSKKK